MIQNINLKEDKENKKETYQLSIIIVFRLNPQHYYFKGYRLIFRYLMACIFQVTFREFNAESPFRVLVVNFCWLDVFVGQHREAE